MEHELKAMHVMVCLNCPCKAKTKHDVQIYFDPDVRYKYSSLIYVENASATNFIG